MGRDKERYPYDNHVNSRKRNRFLRILDFAVFVLTAITAFLLLCAYISRYVNPNDVWFFAFAGLAAPILYVINIVFALYWTIRWKRYAILPWAVLIVGTGWISLFFRPTLNKNYTPPNKKSIVVMSYNSAGFLTSDPAGKQVSTLDSMAAFIGRIKPDILCIQEFQCNSAERKHVLDSLIGLPYNKVNYKIPNSAGGGWGLAIYSNYRILGSGRMEFENSTNSALWADLWIKGDTVRVFNCHLQTTSVDQSDREYIANQEFISDDLMREERMRSIVGKLRRNFLIRASQVDSLAPIIHGTPYKVIVCGDFNDTPMSYAYRKMRGPLADAFVDKGTGIPNTYQGLFNLFRIDYILHSREITTVNYTSPAGDYSDHKAVIANIDMQ